MARVTNGRYFSYLGYNEILSGFTDDEISSNAKRPNCNITVLEWLNQKPSYQGRVAAFGSWEVFPFIINQERSGIYVNAGWQELEFFADASEKQQWNLLAEELPRYWPDGRYDLYLDAAYRSDQYIKQLWEACQQLDEYRDKTSQIAAMVAALLGEDFDATDDGVAQPLPGVFGGGE